MPSRSTLERIRRSNTSGTSLPAAPLRRHTASSLTKAPVSTSEETRSSKNSGLPSTPAHKASMMDSPAPAPMSERAKARSASSGKGESSTLRSGQQASDSSVLSRADTPGSGSGRLVARSNRGVSSASAAISSVRRNEVGSDQCRSSSTSTVGPLSANRATTARTAAKVARWRPSGLSPARRASSGPERRPRMWANRSMWSV